MLLARHDLGNIYSWSWYSSITLIKAFLGESSLCELTIVTVFLDESYLLTNNAAGNSCDDEYLQIYLE